MHSELKTKQQKKKNFIFIEQSDLKFIYSWKLNEQQRKGFQAVWGHTVEY